MKTILIALLLIGLIGRAQEIIPLYGGAIPNATTYKMKEQTYVWNDIFAGYKRVSNPTLEIIKPPLETANGTAVIICPGGGYNRITYQNEGVRTAKELLKHGITVFILKYRLPSDSIMPDKKIGPLQDAQQAIKLVRQKASEWHIDVNKVGIMGFSAGGHLAASAGTHFESSFIPNNEEINLRPDFMILIYPVISLTDKLTHLGSRENLLGETPSQEDIILFSNEFQVNEKTPPTYLTHSQDDQVVSVENSLVFYEALRRQNVPVEMHLYPKGDHGFVLNIESEVWMAPLFLWMRANQLIQLNP